MTTDESTILSDGLQGRIKDLNDNAATQRRRLNGEYQDLKRTYPGNGDFNKHVENTTLEVIGQSRQHAANIARLKQRLADAWKVRSKDLDDAFGETASKDFFIALIKLSALHTFDESMARLREQRTSRQAAKTAGGASRKRAWVPQDAQNALKKAQAETEPGAHPSPSIEGGRGQSADPDLPDDLGGDNDFSDDGDYFEDNYGGSGSVDDNLDSNLAESLLEDQNEPDFPAPPPKRRRCDSSASSVLDDPRVLLTPKLARYEANVGTKMGLSPSKTTQHKQSKIGVGNNSSVIPEERIFQSKTVLQSSPCRGTSAPPSPTPIRNKEKGKAAVRETSEDEEDGAMPINAKVCEQLVDGQMLHSSVVDRVVELAVSTRPEWRAIDSSSFTNPIPLRHVMRANEKENTLIGAFHQHGHWTLVRCIRDADVQVRKEHWDSIAGGGSNATVDSLLDVFLDKQPNWTHSAQGRRRLSERLCPSQLNNVDCGVFVAVVFLFLCADQSLPSALNTRLWRRVLFCLLKDGGDVDGDELHNEESDPGRLSTLSPTGVLALVRDVGERTVAARLRKEQLDRVAHATRYVDDLHEVEDLARALDARASRALAAWQGRRDESTEDAARQDEALKKLEACAGRDAQLERQLGARAKSTREEASLAGWQVAAVGELRRGLARARALAVGRLDPARRQVKERQRALVEMEKLMMRVD